MCGNTAKGCEFIGCYVVARQLGFYSSVANLGPALFLYPITGSAE